MLSNHRLDKIKSWTVTRSALANSLTELTGPPRILETAEEFQRAARSFDEALRRTVEMKVPRTRPHPHTKRWWTEDLTKLASELKQLQKTAHRYRALPEHGIHAQVHEKENALSKEIRKTKEDHWKNWLNDMAGTDIWIAHKYISNPGRDGGKTWIPTLRATNTDGQLTHATTNAPLKPQAPDMYYGVESKVVLMVRVENGL